MTEHNFEQMRRAMVASQLRTTGVNDPRVVAAMGSVPREHFVPKDRIPVAYADAIVPLTDERELNSPMALGRMLTEVSPRREDRALVIGAATGYAAAVLSELVASVVAVEEESSLAAQAREALAGYGVRVVESPLAVGCAESAPYDLILIDGAVEFVPEAIIEQLSEHGRLAAVILDEGVTRVSIGRRGGTGFGMVSVSDVAAPVLPGFVKPRGFVF